MAIIVGGNKKSFSSLSYASIEFADKYFEYDLNASIWADLDEEIIRARAIADIAKNIVENANTILKAKKFQYESLGKENITIPKLIEGE